MVVTAALIWWNERIEDLAACVRGMASIADRLVAVDGSYTRYPGATVRSSKEEAAVIRETAREVGIEATVMIPKDLWPGQVAKRAYAFETAAKDSDWVAAFDGDWIASGNRLMARQEVEATEADVVSVPFYTPPSDNEPATYWHQGVSDTQIMVPHLFRALPELTYERYHWWISALKGRRKVWLWGPGDGRALLKPHPLEAPYLIRHMTLHRTREQVRASRAWLTDRVKVVEWTDQEDDMPHLPRPEFDFDTILTLKAQRQARRKMSARQRHLMRRQGHF